MSEGSLSPDNAHPTDDATMEDAPSANVDASEQSLKVDGAKSDDGEPGVGQVDGSGGESGGGFGGEGENGGGEDSEGGQGGTSFALPFIMNDSARMVQDLMDKPIRLVNGVYHVIIGTIQSWIGELLKVVPDKVIVALISLVSTFFGARYKAHRDAAQAKLAQQEAANKRKEAVERFLRKTYSELAAPILKSAAKLAERLHVLVDGDWERVHKSHAVEDLSPAYSAYLLGRYLAMVEIIKRERALLDYGFPAADRILANIIGRLQGILSANDALLIEMQQTEHLFLPKKGHKPLLGGPLYITSRAQAALGELLLRKLWQKKYDFVNKVDDDNMKRGSEAVLSFLEFSQVLEHDKTLAKWYKPVIEQFRDLETCVQRTERRDRTCNGIGARVYFLQSGLLDLVEFFDPLPQAQAIPFYRRRRLRLGQLRYSEEQRVPMSLHLLYKELANVRDHHVASSPIDRLKRLQLPNGEVEVHVKASAKFEDRAERAVQETVHGDCPYSQRVLIVLEELGIPYRTVFIPARSKPSWFYLLHPENRTPVIYHDGNLVEDSKHIVSYLLEHFPPSNGKNLGSAKNLHLNIGTAAFLRFHKHFIDWVKGDKEKRIALEREMRLLDTMIGRAQMFNDGKPFLGGDKFAREDTAIAPMLNNVDVAGRALKRWGIPDDCRALHRYLHAARQVPSFEKTVGDDESIVAGYTTLSTIGERTWRLADMLE